MSKRYHASFKRGFAVFLALVMCIGMLQTTAMAATLVEATLTCEQDEHTHSASCYTEVSADGAETNAAAADETNPETEEPNAPVVNEPEDTESETAEPEDNESEATEPEDNESEATEPEDNESEATESEDNESEATEPEDNESEATEPEDNESEATEPEDNESETAEPEDNESEDASSEDDSTSSDSDEELVASSISYSAAPSTESTKVLTCGKNEHSHSSSCYSSEGLLDKLLDTLKSDKEEDKEVVLILNGTTLDLSKESGQIYVDGEGRTLTIQDGKVAGGTIDAHGSSTDYRRVIVVKNGGSVSLNGSTTLTGGYGNGGGAVFVGSGSSFTMNGGTISGNESKTSGGGVFVENGSSFTMNGGTISDNKTETSGGGVFIGDGSTFTMTDGTISGNSTNISDSTEKDIPVGQGGGVFVTGGSTFNLEGGVISGNEAGEGGGVFIDQNVTEIVKDENGKEIVNTLAETTFNMTGGKIDGNTAHIGEGGGVYIQGVGNISKGEITNNETKTEKDLGGGGIYVETMGLLNLKNAIITENYAAGLGGGVAACVHGKTVVYVKNGALIFNNDNGGAANSQGHGGNGNKIDGNNLWEGQQDFIDSAKDFFTASDGKMDDWTTQHYGAGGVIVGADVLGGGSANWTGYLFAYDKDGNLQFDENGNPIWVPVEQDANGLYVTSNRLLAMTAHPSPETIEAAKAAAAAAGGVLISGNKSATHGGGIGNNGVMIMGEGPFEALPGDQNLELNKTLTDTRTDEEIPEGESRRELVEGDFTFTVTGTNNPIKLTGTNHADGSVNFTFPENTFTKPGTYTFLVEEVNDGKDGVTYDTTKYLVEIVVTSELETVGTLGTETVQVEILSVGTPAVYKVIFDEAGNVLSKELVADGAISFNNTYYKPLDKEPPEEEKKPPEEEEKKEEPKEEREEGRETQYNPPSETSELPSEETPLAEIPEEVTPLEEIVEEEIIPEEEVPLSDIPQTGDISIIWYAAVLMAICGLLTLRIFARREEEEA